VLVLPLFFFPWFAVLPVSVVRTWQRKGARSRRAFLLAWAISPFLVFSFLRTKLPHYVLPAYPALAIMCGAALDELIEANKGLWRTWAGRLGLVLFGLVGVAAAVGVAVAPEMRGLPRPARIGIPTAAVLLVMTGWVLADLLRGAVRRGVVTMTVLMVAAALTMSLRMAPVLEELYTSKDLALEIQREFGDEPVVCLGLKEQASLVFYLRRNVRFIRRTQQVQVEHADGEAVLAVVLPSRPPQTVRLKAPVVCVTRGRETQNVAALGPAVRKVRQVDWFDVSRMKWNQLTLWEIKGGGPPGDPAPDG